MLTGKTPVWDGELGGGGACFFLLNLIIYHTCL